MNKIDGTDGADRLVGTSGADDMSGGAGKDRLNGGDGDDILRGGADQDYVYGDGGNDTLYGGDGNDALVGHSGNDVIYGEDGNDGVFGGGNDDRIYGGAGNDTLYGDGGDDLIDGGEGDDRLFGGSGNDTLVYGPGGGVDELVGNRGSDTVRIELTAADLDVARAEFSDFASWLEAQISAAGGENAHAGLNSSEGFTFSSFGLTVSSIERAIVVVDGQEFALSDILNASPVAAASQSLAITENASLGGAVGAHDPDGDALFCTVSEGPANGTCELDPNTGDFTYTPVAGFSGTDSFTVLIDDGRGGTAFQTVNVEVAAVADAPTLSANVFDQTSSQIEGTGGSDRIVGTSGDDTISGGEGNDTIFGDAGENGGSEVALDIAASLNDADGSESLTVRVDGLPEGASLSAGTDMGGGTWELQPGDLSGLTLSLAAPQPVTLSITAIATEANGDTAETSQALQISPAVMGGNDVIAGGPGNDTIVGGAGHDIADYSGSQGGVYADLGWGVGLGEGVDRLEEIEGLRGSDHADVLVGDDGDNSFEGGDGADAIYGFGGDDTISGGAGGDSLHGYSGDDVISGGTGDDQIDGGSGTDTVTYAGADGGVTVNLESGKATGADGRDRISEIENITGTAYADDLTGDRGMNVIAAGAGDDVIRSHRGADTLSGGAGNDTFTYTKSDVVSGRNHHGVDRITDFGAGDRLDFEDLLKGVKYDSLADVVKVTETDEGTLLSVDLNGHSGFTDVVLLEGVFDLDLDYLDGGGQVIV